MRVFIALVMSALAGSILGIVAVSGIDPQLGYFLGMLSGILAVALGWWGAQ